MGRDKGRRPLGADARKVFLSGHVVLGLGRKMGKGAERMGPKNKISTDDGKTKPMMSTARNFEKWEIKN